MKSVEAVIVTCNREEYPTLPEHYDSIYGKDNWEFYGEDYYNPYTKEYTVVVIID